MFAFLGRITDVGTADTDAFDAVIRVRTEVVVGAWDLRDALDYILVDDLAV
jgi:hypothetical protein